jgi:periplasmic copper chaperone A
LECFPTSVLRHAALAATLVTASWAAMAQTTVQDAWVRGTVAQQKATGMFARITSAQGGKLVGASSPVAGVVEVHEMAMDGNVMKMRAVPALDLPAGKAVELKPGGYHVMLLDLKQALKDGETVAVTLVVEGKDGKRESVEVKAPVRPLTSAAGKGNDGHGDKEHKH